MSDTPSDLSPLTDEERAELKALCDAATDGPWQIGAVDMEGMVCIDQPHWDLCTVEAEPQNVACILTNRADGDAPNADLRLIAAARTALPKLLAENEGLRKQTEWQDIASAPKGGVLVQVYGIMAGEIHGPAISPSIGSAFFCGDRTDYPGYNWLGNNTDAHAIWWKPTHWKLLPLPPEER